MFWLSHKTLEALKYFGPYRLAFLTGPDLVRTFLVIHPCSKIDWTKTALQHGFVSYGLENGEVFDFEKEAVPGGKHPRGASVTSMSVNLIAIPVVYRDVVSRVSLKLVQLVYDEYRIEHSSCNEASREAVPMVRVQRSCSNRSCYAIRLRKPRM